MAKVLGEIRCPDLLVSMPTAERPKPMHVRRTILCLAALCLAALCLAATFLWATHDPDMASGQSAELTEAYNSFTALYQQGRYSEAEPYAKKALGLGRHEFGPDHPTTATPLNNLAALYPAQGNYAKAERLPATNLPAIRKSKSCADGNTTPISWRWRRRRPNLPFAARKCSTALYRRCTCSM